jgi:uncharacterized membrane protein YgaE (UPF0421/DUF939 family)
VITQSTFDTSLPISAQRFAGTAVGTLVGALAVTYFLGSTWVFGLTVFAIVMLVPRSTAVSLVAIHRFFEVSIGIAVGLVLSALWPEPLDESVPRTDRI